MLVMKSYKFRMYPSIEQQVLINKIIGCTRFVYNQMLAEKMNNQSMNRFDLNKEIPKLYQEYAFLKEVDSMSLRCAINDNRRNNGDNKRKNRENIKFPTK